MTVVEKLTDQTKSDTLKILYTQANFYWVNSKFRQHLDQIKIT